MVLPRRAALISALPYVDSTAQTGPVIFEGCHKSYGVWIGCDIGLESSGAMVEKKKAYLSHHKMRRKVISKKSKENKTQPQHKYG